MKSWIHLCLSCCLIGLCTLSITLLPRFAIAASSEQDPLYVVIELPTRAMLSSGPVYLGDVAILRTNNLPLIRELMQLRVGWLSASAGIVDLSQEDIQRALRRVQELTKGRGVRIVWAGELMTTVVCNETQVDTNVLIRSASDALQGWLLQRGMKGSFETQNLLLDIKVPCTHPDVRARPIQNLLSKQEQITVWTDIYCAGRMQRAIPVDFYFHRNTLEDLSLAHETKNLGSHSLAFTGVDGEPKTGEQDEQNITPLVHRGQQIKVVTMNGTIRLESKATALQEGRIGQTIQARTTSQNSIVYARVVAAGLVEVMK